MTNAGVVGASSVFTPVSNPQTGMGGPAMWSFVWVGVAALVLMFLHLAIAGRAGR